MPILTIDSARLNGTPSTGTVRITASRSPLMDSGSNTVYSGTQTFPLDAQGKLSVSLPATDSPSIGPFTYTVEANLASGQWIYRGVKLPANVATIDITDAQSASQNMYPTRQEWDAITAGMNTTIEGKVDGPGMGLRVDNSVGTRVLLDHPGGTTMLMGDTGSRVITASLLNGWAGTAVRLTRTGNVVSITGRIDGTAKTGDRFYSLPAGFRPPGGISYTLPNRIAGSTLTIIDGVHLETTYAAAFGNIFETWTTRDPWPATLPGTP